MNTLHTDQEPREYQVVFQMDEMLEKAGWELHTEPGQDEFGNTFRIVCRIRP